MAFDTGNAATAAFTSGATYSFSIVSMSLGSQSVAVLETSHLGTTGFKTYIPGDLKEPNQVSFAIRHDPTIAHPVPGTAATLDVTFPDSGTGGTDAVLDGTGFVVSFDLPELANETVQDATMVWQFDGATGPTFTPEV